MSSLGSPNPFFIAGKKAYEVERSLRFNKGDNPVLTRSPSSTTDSTKQTLSFWFKISSLIDATNQGAMVAGGSDGSYAYVQFYSNTFYFGNSAAYWYGNLTLRDFSAWYHAVIVIDTTQSTANDRQKLYINGVQQERGGGNNPSEDANYEFLTNSSWTYYIGKRVANDMNFDGYMAEVNFVQGLALTPSSFAETDAVTGEYKPKKYTGGYGTNGFYLNFSDNSGTTATTLGKDSSGNGNNFTPNNFATSDAVKDSPTNNFCTLDPNQGVFSATGTNTYSEGNLKVSTPSSGTGACAGNFGFTSGKWYAEVYVVANTGLNRAMVGVTGNRIDTIRNAGNWGENSGSGDVAYFGQNGKKHINSSETSYGDTYTVGDIVGVALDLDNRTVNFYKNNTAQGTISIGSTGDWIVGTGDTSGGAGSTVVMNFGQDSSFAGNKTAQGNADGNGKGDFYYSPPSGFVAMCSANFPDPTIKQPNKHFDILLWTGTAASHTLTGLNFQPDFLWAKSRSQGYHHTLIDSARGTNKQLWTDRNSDEQTNTSFLTSFNSNGVTLGDNSSGTGATNTNGHTYVGWFWKGGGTASSNSDGGITSSVSANTSAGFSIVTYTGTGSQTTIGHGLGVKPKLIITKLRTSAQDWMLYPKQITGNGATYIKFNTSDGPASDAHTYPDVEPTSTVYTVGGDDGGDGTNGNSKAYVAYCWSEVANYSKFGIYKGNGNTDGSFIYTGFSPSMLWYWKLSGENRHILDFTRDPLNPNTLGIDINRGAAEADDSNLAIDFLSNGFKLRTSHSTGNSSGVDYIYFAFAESPFKYARAR